MKLQPGDYVSTEGMTEEEYRAVCRAFMETGANKNEYGLFDKDTCNCVGWGDHGIFHGMNLGRPGWDGGFTRKLTKDQILGAQKMDIREAYKLMQANCGIEVGDTVKVLRKAKSCEMGWGAVWASDMNEFVGEIGEVQRISDGGIYVHCDKLKDCFWFPFFVLELVDKGKKLPEPIKISSSYDVTFNEDGSINVGCQHIDLDTLEKAYLTAKGVISND